MKIEINRDDAQILVYALRDFASRFSDPNMDSKAKKWARDMSALAADVDLILETEKAR